MRLPGTKFNSILFKMVISPYPALALSIVISGFGNAFGSANSKLNGESACAGANFSIRSSAFTRLCACLALLAFALKRVINCSR